MQPGTSSFPLTEEQFEKLVALINATAQGAAKLANVDEVLSGNRGVIVERVHREVAQHRAAAKLALVGEV